MAGNTIPLTKEELSIMSSTTQGVDNQYVPYRGLHTMEQKKVSREAYRRKIRKSIEAEFRRALLYSDSVVINRAFIINTEELYKPLLSSGPEKTAYLDLVRSQAVIPYLYSETSITESDPAGFSKRDSGTLAVAELERELGRVPCVRFSWNEEQNKKDANRSAKAFTSYVMSARLVAEQIAKDLKIADVNAFKKKLNEVTAFCTEVFDKTGRDYVTRQQLYTKFVCAEGSTDDETKRNVIQGSYDFAKPFWKELKLIFDLKYQANSADSLHIQTLTGRDLPERSVLHELDMAVEFAPASENMDLSTLFADVVFGQLASALWIRTINDLTLQDIVTIRENCDEYRYFLDAARQLKVDARRAIDDVQVGKKGVDAPLDFGSFVSSFLKYQNAIRGITSSKSASKIKPAIQIIINVGAVVITALTDDKVVKLSGGTADKLSDPAATVIAKVIAGASRGVDLGINYNFMRTRVSNARDEYERLLQMFKRKGYEIVSSAQARPHASAIATQDQLSYPES